MAYFLASICFITFHSLSNIFLSAVEKNGVPVEYLVFPDEGHGFMKKENEIKAYGQIREFLDKYLKGEGVVELEPAN